MDKNILKMKLVNDIEQDFIIPSYQRGYRWGKKDVTILLDDILENGDKPFCLQPIVVCKDESKYILVDGQQRLTTIYLIYKYLHIKDSENYPQPKFTIDYDIRKESKEFLENIENTDESAKNKYIDFWFMKEAYDAIDEWFTMKTHSTLAFIYDCFEKNVSVLWYEIREKEQGVNVFERLNIGKIPLTSAELIRAMMLKTEDEVYDPNGQTVKGYAHEVARDRMTKTEIGLQWDDIEKDLSVDSIWAFLTNKVIYNQEQSQTHIDLILDLYVEKPEYEKDYYYTFFQVAKQAESKEFNEIWNEIVMIYLKLKDWYEDNDIYHKVGYLITSNSLSLSKIFKISKGKTKTEFKEELDKKIKKSIKIDKNYAELKYDKSSDKQKLYKLLLLFNVESIRRHSIGKVSDSDEETDRDREIDIYQKFPFQLFKKTKGSLWSLEHIHAQQSKGLSKEKAYREWVTEHKKALEEIAGENDTNDIKDVIDEASELLEQQRIEGDKFEQIHKKIVRKLSSNGEEFDGDGLDNLAILKSGENAVLSNSTFDVKRNKIIQLEKEGSYIPFCTKMVFLKYYSDSSNYQIHFWGKEDRQSYIAEINRVLNKYLDTPIDY